jgi:dolichol-phosphate mannosyltransferase
VNAPFPHVRLGVVTPMANEAATAVAFVDAVLAACREFPLASLDMFVVLDGASRDATRALLEASAGQCPELAVVWAPECRGVADAYVRGYRAALSAGCDWVLEIDAGFSHDPGEISSLLRAMDTGKDCVFGTRFADGAGHRGTRWRRTVSRAGTQLANIVLGTRLSDMTGGFELFSRDALEGVLRKGIRSKGPFFQTEIKAHCRDLAFAEVPIHYDSASHRVGAGAIAEALANLARLAGLRLVGAL